MYSPWPGVHNHHINSDYIDEDLKNCDVLRNKFTELNEEDDKKYDFHRSIKTNASEWGIWMRCCG